MSNVTFNALIFKVGNEKFVSLLNQINETLKCPTDYLIIPGTKKWLLGATKYGGKELPLIDLRLLGSVSEDVGELDEILVVSRYSEVQGKRQVENIGLVVGEILSISKVDVKKDSYSKAKSKYFGEAEMGEVEINGAKSKLLDLRALVESENLAKVSIS